MPDDFHRLLWVMLPLGLDCEGRGLDNPGWIKAKIMPLRLDVTPEMIESAMIWFATRGMIERYTVDKRTYFWVPSFARYQGNTTKEADSEYPPPPSVAAPEPVAPNSGPAPDLLPPNSGTDSDADSDADSEEEGASAPPAPTGNGKREPTGRNAIKAELESFFVALTQLKPPQTDTAKQRKAAGRLWWGPLLKLAAECGDDVERTKNLIRWALGEMDKDELTVSNPNSIVNIAIAEQARRKRINGTSTGQPSGSVFSNVTDEQRDAKLARLARGAGADP